MKTSLTLITTYTMSWLDRKKKTTYWIGLIIISALFLVNCEDPSELGLNIVPPQDNLGVQFVDLQLGGSTVLLDSVETSSTNILMSGKYEDDLFGSVKTQFYTQFFPLGALPSSFTDVDSIQLQLRINYFHGDDFSQESQSFSIHQLTENLYDSLDYYGFQITTFDPISIGDTTVVFDPKIDSLLIVNLTFPDTTLLNASRNFTSSDVEAFSEAIKGLTVVPDEGNTAIVGFDPNAATTHVTIYYTTNDTVVNRYQFPLGVSTTRSQGPVQYNNISADRSASSLSALTMPFTPYEDPNGDLYLQTGTGVIPKLDFQTFFDFVQADTTGTIIVNEARLVFKNLKGIGDNLQPPAETAFFFSDSESRLLDVDTSSSFFPGSIQIDQIYISANELNINPLILRTTSSRAILDTLSLDYNVEVGLFLQGIADGKFTEEEGKDILIYPFSFVSEGRLVQSNGRNLDRFVVNSSDIRLRIYYTFLR